jgi:large subunit ribosomal protein L9
LQSRPHRVISLSFAKKVGEEEKLFGSVTAHDIEVELKAQGFELERKAIHLEEHIKTLGSHTVEIKVAPEVTAKITVEVVKEEESE